MKKQNDSLTRSLSILRDLKENVFRCKCCRSKFSFLRPSRKCMVCMSLVCQGCSKARWKKDKIPTKNLREAKRKHNYRVCKHCVTNNPNILLEQLKKSQDDHILSMYLTTPVEPPPVLTEKNKKPSLPHPMQKYFYDPSKDESSLFKWEYNPAALSGVRRSKKKEEEEEEEENNNSSTLPSPYTTSPSFKPKSFSCTSIEISPKVLRSNSCAIRSYYGRGAYID